MPGLEVAGVVVKVGAQVTAFTPGDRVCALTNGGGYAEYCAVPAGQTLPIPAGLSAKRPPFRKPSSPSGRTSSSWVSCSPAKAFWSTAAPADWHHRGPAVPRAGDDRHATVGRRKIAALRPYATAINYKTDDFAEKIGQLTNDEGWTSFWILLAALTLTATLGY